MSRKKAIEAAIGRAFDEVWQGEPEHAEKAAGDIACGYAYDSGVIAGLREAAKIFVKHDQWLPAGPQAEIRERARELAKKARGK